MIEPLTDSSYTPSSRSSSRPISPFSFPQGSPEESDSTVTMSTAGNEATTDGAPSTPIRAPEGPLDHVDALRAVALISVWFFHFDVPFFRGGYVGVDMFFTISGYVITRNMLSALQRQSFSFPRFYKRRFLRLFPAACTTVLTTTLLTYLFISPGDEKAGTIFKSGLASLTMSSNFYFNWQGISYFDTESFYLTPLLHFWSLSLEEQFYVVWAPLIGCIWAVCGRMVVMLHGGDRYISVTNQGTRVNVARVYVAMTCILAILGIGSFCLAHIKYSRDPNYVFYLLPARAFEFVIGGLVAIRNEIVDIRMRFRNPSPNGYSISYDSINQQANANSPIQASARSSNQAHTDRPSDDEHVDVDQPDEKDDEINDVHDLISIGSFLTLLLSFVFLPFAATPLQLVPTLLSTLMLLAFPNSVVCNILTLAPFLLRLGRASYSLYLVHWPVSVIIELILSAFNVPHVLIVSALLPLSYTLGMMLHKYIEVPFRNACSLRSVLVLALFGLLTALFTGYGAKTNGYQDRFPELGESGWRIGSPVKGMEFSDVQQDVSHMYSHGKDVYVKRVGDINSGSMSRYVFFGDSFTEHLTFALHNVGLRRKQFFELHYSPHCGFRPTAERSERTRAHGDESKYPYGCGDVHRVLWEHVNTFPNDNSSVLVIANFWQDHKQLHFILNQLQLELKKHGKTRFALFKEPPGISRSYRNYYPCADLHVIFYRMLTFWRKEGVLDGRKCLPASLTTKPHDIVAAELRFYGAFWFMYARNVPVFDLFKHLCIQHGKPLDFAFTCRPPAQIPDNPELVYDIGYKQDLLHLSPVGSDYVSEYVEHELYRGAVLNMG